MSDAVSLDLSTIEPRRPSEPEPTRHRALRQLGGSPAAVISAVFLALMALLAICAPIVATHEPNAQTILDRLQGPSRDHLLGTDSLGRDIFSRLLFGARVSLVAASLATAIAIGLGVPAGLVAGSVGRTADTVLRTISDLVMSVPPLVLSLVIIGVLGPSLRNAMISVGVVVAPRFFRIARGAARSVRHETYVEAARSVGCSPFRVLWRHVLPNTSGPLLVQTSFVVGLAIVAEASLSFLGLGVQPPQSSWGSMLQQAYQALGESSWSFYPPATAIATTVLACSLLGDSIRDALGGGFSDR
jgi:peptide/nickel transport system permease protein